MSNTLVVEALKNVLADSYALYLKTQNYHWNIESPNFKALHVLFEEQYMDLAEAVDTVAELIRALGAKAPGTFAAYSQRTSIQPGDENASAQTMVEELLADQLTLQKTLAQALAAAHQDSDEVVAGFVTERLTVHRKAAWMLKSSR
jgi:starvation-inducible DNA-binding protein